MEEIMSKSCSLLLVSLLLLASFSSAKELPKIAVWNLEERNIPAPYAKELTSILVSEITKSKTYEVYSQDNVRTLAGWTAERMALGCTDTKCLTALGQMDIAKLVSGSVGKIGDRYSVSLNLFNTQNAKVENAVSEFGRSENELIDLVQMAVQNLLGIPTLTGKGDRPRQEGQKSQLEANRYDDLRLWNMLAGKWESRDGAIYGSGPGRHLVLRESLKDCTFEVTAEHLAGPFAAVGIGARSTILPGNAIQGYVFNFAFDQTYNLFNGISGKWYLIRRDWNGWQSSNLLGKQKNTIRFESQGTSHKIYVNGNFLVDFSDKTHLIGSPYIWVEDPAQNIRFSNIRIYRRGD
jgi:hypothetical protein